MPKSETCTPRPLWMSAESIRMIDTRASHRRRPDHNFNVERTLAKEVWWYLLLDTRRRTDVTAEDIGVCLELEAGTQEDLYEAYTILKRWYKHS